MRSNTEGLNIFYRILNLILHPQYLSFLMKKSLMRLVCLCMMHSLIGYSQNVLDSLQLRLNRTDNTSEKILLQVTIAGKLVSSSVDSAINYCYEGLKFSKQIKNDSLERRGQGFPALADG